jgi:hypothetical protein
VVVLVLVFVPDVVVVVVVVHIVPVVVAVVIGYVALNDIPGLFGCTAKLRVGGGAAGRWLG